ncbi:MAG: hypothetical protein J6N15_12795 [Ruminiclostridium sp.]|nr:hypothetical protein [Ruminiclostridium sp.]
MKMKLKALILLLCCAVTMLLVPVISSAAAVNGVGVSKSELSPDDVFDLIISVPPSESADTAFIRVEFDSSVFDVVSWAPNVHNCIYNSGAGFLVLTSANANRDIDLSHGLEISATMHVNRNAAAGGYEFTLVEHSLSYVADNGYEFRELWSPTAIKAGVRVTSPVQSTTAATTDSRITVSPVVSNTPSQDTLRPSDYAARDDENDTTASNITDTADKISDGEEEILVSDDNDDDSIEITADDGPEEVTASPAASVPAGSSSGDPEVSMSSTLKGISGTIRLATEPRFFNGSAEVRFSCSAATESEARSAVGSIGSKFSRYFPFDITLYDSTTGEKLTLPSGGYIDFTFPVPSGYSGKNIRVYHVKNGVPELITSTVTSVNGSNVINFRASAFSTYIIAELETEAAASAATAGKPANPHTGVAAAIAVPSLLAGCLILSGKGLRKRKRSKKYIEE